MFLIKMGCQKHIDIEGFPNWGPLPQIQVVVGPIILALGFEVWTMLSRHSDNDI